MDASNGAHEARRGHVRRGERYNTDASLDYACVPKERLEVPWRQVDGGHHTSIVSAFGPGTVTGELAAFLRGRTAGATESAFWGNGAIPLRIDAYPGGDQPPLDLVTSVRALVLNTDSVLVFWDATNRPQLLPGGRREGDETLLETCRREVLEETGVEPLYPLLFGSLCYHHLGPRPPDYTFPYPDFIQPVFLARPGEERPESRVHDPHVARSAFRSLTEVEKLPLRPVDRCFLTAALGRQT